MKVAIVPKWIEGVLVDQREGCDDIHEKYIPISPFFITTELNQDGSLDLDNAEIVWATCLQVPNKIDGISFRFNEISHELDRKDWCSFMESVKIQYKERFNIDWDDDCINDTDGKKHDIKTIKNREGKSVIIMRDETVTGTKNAIIKLLIYLINKPIYINSLFRKMIGGKVDSQKCQPQVGLNLLDHLGQMKNEYPLADAQRHAIHCMANLPDGNVLAVSGPPGTGKTTMLQSVVADMIVKHALDGKKPPVILATSSNNKAITNIIDAFKIENENNVADVLFTRWIQFRDNPLSLAVYLPSSQAKDKDKFFCSDEIGGGNYQDIRDSLDECKRYFVEMAEKSNLLKGGNIASIRKQLYQELKNTYNLLEKIQLSIKKPQTTNKRKGLWRKILEFIQGDSHKTLSDKEIEEYLVKHIIAFNANSKSLKTDEIDKLYLSKQKEKTVFSEYTDKMLDRCLRFKCFWLAVHYYEASWLHIVEENSGLELKNQFREDIYNEMSFLCPCFVATFFKTPNCFKTNKNANEGPGYLFNFIDLLIVDEAGQTCSEIGIPSFALAKKAIVVGDEDQIPPIYTIKTGTSKWYMEDLLGERKLNDMEDRKIFKLIDCSNSSIMKIASNRSYFNRIWSDGETLKGLFLDEHRRCYDEIIAYCNKLIYKGRLKSLGGNPKEGESVMPVMAYLYVPHKKSEKPPTGSRKSEDEAQAIVDWIKKNEQIIKRENHNKDLKDIISVITPFSHQAKIIKKELNDLDIPVGTVHTFQGAESPIVIYSTVYGSEEKFSFVNGNKQLMNVAVSRAKKHFFLFCSKKPDMIGQDDSPFNLLLKMTKTELKDDYN